MQFFHSNYNKNGNNDAHSHNEPGLPVQGRKLALGVTSTHHSVSAIFNFLSLCAKNILKYSTPTWHPIYITNLLSTDSVEYLETILIQLTTPIMYIIRYDKHTAHILLQMI